MPSRELIPEHLIEQVKDGKGGTFRQAIHFFPSDYQSYIKLEYNLIDLIATNHHTQYIFVQQTLLITRFYKVYDVVEVKTKSDEVIKFYFDISNVFGFGYLLHGGSA